MSRWPVVVLALAFPLLAHAAALLKSDALALASVAALVLAIVWPLRARPLPFAILLGLGALLLGTLGASGHARTALMLPPILITFAIAWQFARSLHPARTPLVQRIVVALHAEALDIPGVRDYTRRVTRLWAVLLGTLCAVDAVLALLAVPDGFLHAAGVTPVVAVPLATWSFVANVVNYLVIAAVFAIEYLYRGTRFPQQPYRNFADFIGRVARLGPDFWRGR